MVLPCHQYFPVLSVGGFFPSQVCFCMVVLSILEDSLIIARHCGKVDRIGLSGLPYRETLLFDWRLLKDLEKGSYYIWNICYL